MEKAGKGYKVLPSWRWPLLLKHSRKIDLWFPEIAPSPSLSRKYRRNKISWDDLALNYKRELKSAAAAELLKPLALLSLRKQLVLLCDCKAKIRCPNRILAACLNELRENNDFVMKSK